MQKEVWELFSGVKSDSSELAEMSNNGTLLIMERYNLLLNKAVWGFGIVMTVKAFWDHTSGPSGLKDKYNLKLILLKDHSNKSNFLLAFDIWTLGTKYNMK